jgi:hypothetical protein
MILTFLTALTIFLVGYFAGVMDEQKRTIAKLRIINAEMMRQLDKILKP